jgi:hypothetical protein
MSKSKASKMNGYAAMLSGKKTRGDVYKGVELKKKGK